MDPEGAAFALQGNAQPTHAVDRAPAPEFWLVRPSGAGYSSRGRLLVNKASRAGEDGSQK